MIGSQNTADNRYSDAKAARREHGHHDAKAAAGNPERSHATAARRDPDHCPTRAAGRERDHSAAGRKRYSRACDAVFLILVVLAVCFLAWKARFGFANIDENFYLTIPWRLCQGDALFTEEWHLSQMSGFLLLPFVYVYRLLHTGTDGMLLTFRYICIAVQTVFCIYCYICLKKISRLGAVFASLLLLIYVPYNITALSYNSMGVLLMTAAAVTIATCGEVTEGIKCAPQALASHTAGQDAGNAHASSPGRMRFRLAAAGAAFAGAVLCCPYLIAVYAIYTVAAIGAEIIQRRPHRPVMSAGRQWFWFTLGAALVAAVFAAFVFSRATLSEIIKAFPLIFRDAEHDFAPVSVRLVQYIKDIYHCTPHSEAVFFFLAAVFAAALADRRRRYRAVWLALAAAAVLALLGSLLVNDPYINKFMFPANLMSVFFLILGDDRRMPKLFFAVVVPGMLYTVCIYLTSNQRFLAIATVSAAALAGTAVMAALMVRELIKDFAANAVPRAQDAEDSSAETPMSAAANAVPRAQGAEDITADTAPDEYISGSEKPSLSEFLQKAACIAAAALTASVFMMTAACLVHMRRTHVFWENSPEQQTVLLTEGPENGILATPEKAEYYARLLRSTESLRDGSLKKDSPDGTNSASAQDPSAYAGDSDLSVLFLSKETWLYLACPDVRMASFSAWLSGINGLSVERPAEYYKLNPDKIPDVVFTEIPNTDFAGLLNRTLGYREFLTAEGDLLLVK